LYRAIIIKSQLIIIIYIFKIINIFFIGDGTRLFNEKGLAYRIYEKYREGLVSRRKTKINRQKTFINEKEIAIGTS
jgi:hypothetical protein